MSLRRNLLLSGGPGSHDFAALAAEVDRTLARDGIVTEVVHEPAAVAARLTDPSTSFDLLTVLALRWTMGQERYAHDRDRWAHSPTEATRAAITDHVAAGGGLLALHTACVCFDDWPGWGDLLGAAWEWGRSSHEPIGEAVVELAGRSHPITHGLAPFTLTDEVYEDLATRDGLEPLLTSRRRGRDQPVLWARAHGRGRVVVDALGHDVTSLRHPAHGEVLRRSARWAMGQPDDAVGEQEQIRA